MLALSIILSSLLYSGTVDAAPRLTIISVHNGGPWGTWGPVAMCPDGTVAIGFAIKVEDRVLLGDNTAMNGIRLYCGSSNSTSVTEIESTTQMWGMWGARTTCLSGGFLSSFSLRVEAATKADTANNLAKVGDDTAANDIMFRCNMGEELTGNGMYFGYWGDWSSQCTAGICGVQTKVEPDQGLIDDTALNDVQFYCC